MKYLASLLCLLLISLLLLNIISNRNDRSLSYTVVVDVPHVEDHALEELDPVIVEPDSKATNEIAPLAQIERIPRRVVSERYLERTPQSLEIETEGGEGEPDHDFRIDISKVARRVRDPEPSIFQVIVSQIIAFNKFSDDKGELSRSFNPGLEIGLVDKSSKVTKEMFLEYGYIGYSSIGCTNCNNKPESDHLLNIDSKYLFNLGRGLSLGPSHKTVSGLLVKNVNERVEQDLMMTHSLGAHLGYKTSLSLADLSIGYSYHPLTIGGLKNGRLGSLELSLDRPLKEGLSLRVGLNRTSVSGGHSKFGESNFSKTTIKTGLVFDF